MLSQLHQIITKDKIPLEGLLFEPKRKSRVAAVWVSGLTGRFSSNPQRIHTLAKTLVANKITFAIFDHRGRDIVAPIKKHAKKKKYILGGAAFERFEHCALDIDAVIGFLRKNGYKKIFLFGHSTGANKIAYYYWKKCGRRISGLGLLGPISDIPALKQKLGRKYRAALKKAQTMFKQGKRDALLSFSLVDGAFYSARRFLSIAGEVGKEDTFPYYDPKRKFYWAKNIRIPVFVLIGGKDQYADRPIPEIAAAFKRQIPPQHFSGMIVAGADHSFFGKEQVMAQAILGWIKNIGALTPQAP